MSFPSIRNAEDKDAELIYNWRNDPFIVSLGSSQKTVTWEEHQVWYQNALSNEAVAIFIIEVEGRAAGQIRFCRENENEATVTIYLMKPYTGKGYGVEVLKNACEIITQMWGVDRILAHIMTSNKNSQTAFHKAGFHEIKNLSEQSNHVCYVREKS